MGAFLAFYILTAGSVYMQTNRFVAYLREFWLMFASGLLAFIADCVSTAVSIARMRDEPDRVKLLHAGWPTSTMCVSQLSYGLFTVCAVYTMAHVLQPKHWST
jgi:hypothetical protein